MIERDQCIKIGFMQKPHGVKGELSLTLGDGVYSNDFETEFLLLDIDNGLVPFYVETSRVRGNKSILVKLETVESESKAKDLSGTEVYVDADTYEGEENLPNSAFVGFTVMDKEKGNVGVIAEVQEISNNPLFVVDCDGNEILIPINSDLILGVDEKGKQIEVDLPEGLVDLYLNEEDEQEEDEEWQQDLG